MGNSRDRGQATVEFALVLPIMVLLVFGTIQFGMLFWTYQQVGAAASEGARKGAVSRTAASPSSAVDTAVKAASPGLTASKVVVTTTSSWTPGQPVTVTVKYPQKVKILGVTFFDKNLSVTRTARVEQ